MDLDKIKKGFPITRNANSSIELYEHLIFEGDGEIQRKFKDYEHRKGLTNKPLTTSDQHSFTILHSYINVLGWFMKVIYRCNAHHEYWIEEKSIDGQPIRDAKKTVQKDLKESLGLTLDQVSGANDKEGNSK